MAEKGWSMKLHGLKELEEIMLKKLPTSTSRRVLLSGLRESVKPMKAAAKAKVVKQSGALAESINTRAARNRGFNDTFASIHLAPMRGNMTAWAMYMAYYRGGGKSGDMDSALGEIGSRIKSGAISSSRARKATISHGHLVEFGFRHHSGKQVPARPFMRPAFDQEVTGFNLSFKNNLAKKIEAAVRKIEKKNAAEVRARK